MPDQNEELEQIEKKPHIIGGEEPHPTVTPDEINQVCDHYKQAKISMLIAEREASYAREDLESFKAELIGKAYADGTISGGNSQTRSAAEDKLVADSKEVARLSLKVREVERKLARAKGTVAAVEERISLLRAFLYSSARMPR